MPAYNEELNIAETVEKWYPIVESVGEDCRLVVANDGSKDKTFSVLKEIERKYPQLVALDKPNGGHGSTVLFLYKYAIANQADFIFQTDSDGQTNPNEFSSFLELIRSYDCVMGCRPVRGDGKNRKMIENILRSYVWLYFRVWLPDANAPFRLMKSSVVSKYLGLMPLEFNLPNAVLAACFTKFHEKVVYRNITFKPRQKGVNSINLKKIFMIGYKAIFDFYKISRNMSVYKSTL